MRVTNNTSRTLDFLQKDGKPKNGVAPTEHIEAGETKDLNVDPKDPTVRGYILAGAITVPDSVAEKVEAEVTTSGPAARKG